MQILYTILYIVLFVISLSLLIVVHELGHLMAAKAFKVYCFEYSIGFGPKLISVKRKHGETYFSLRAIPFGGFVSMYGEGVEVPEGVEIPPERSLDNIKKWKKGIILVAGVTMNTILSIIIFLIANLCFPITEVAINPVTISETNTLVDKSFKTGDLIVFPHEPTDENEPWTLPINVDGVTQNWIIWSDKVTITKTDNTEINDVYAVLKTSLSNYTDLDFSFFLKFMSIDENKQIVTDYSPKSDYLKYEIPVSIRRYQEGNTQTYSDPVETTLVVTPKLNEDGETYSLDSTGLNLTKQSIWLGWKAFGKTFSDFGNGATAIVRTFGSIFTSSEAREGVGGIIAIGFESTSLLKNFGFANYLRLWGIISINLAIVNLLPFPGLDGWQLLVLIVEGISKKKIPDKVKSIVSIVGLVLLFGLMILLVFKDVFKYII